MKYIISKEDYETLTDALEELRMLCKDGSGDDQTRTITIRFLEAITRFEPGATIQ